MGLDVSLTRTGLLVLEGSRARIRSHLSVGTPSTFGELEPRMEVVVKAILRKWKKWQPDIVIMEGGARGGRVVDLSVYHLAGVVRWELWKRDALVVMKAPNTLKAHMGHGQYNKDQMLAAVRERWADCPNHDEGDAWAAADYGLAHYDELILPSA